MIVPAAKIDTLFQAHCPSDGPGCAVGIIQDGVLIYGRGFGQANLDWYLPITTRTAFRVASLSKQFTGACVALLMEEGRVALSDDIRTYLPEFPDFGTPITIDHLLHHTSGIQDFPHLLWGVMSAPPGDAHNEAEVLALLKGLRELDFAPGARFQYCNAGYFLLSVIIRRITGLTLAQYADRHLFEPLGMTGTHFHDDPTRVVKRRAIGYAAAGDSYRIADMPSTSLVGDDGLFTTVEDLVRWDRNFYRNRLGQGRQALVDLMLTPGRLSNGEEVPYGFGHFLGQRRGLRRFWHYGDFMGFQSAVRCFPEQRFTVIVLGNLQSLPAIDLAVQVEDWWLAERFPLPAPVDARGADEEPVETLPPGTIVDLSSYPGTYDTAELGVTYRVWVEKRRLWLANLDPHAARTEELKPLGLDRFEARFGFWRRTVLFRREENRVTGFVIDNEDSAPTRFVRCGTVPSGEGF